MNIKDIMKKQVVNNSLTSKLPVGTYENVTIKAWSIITDANKEEKIEVKYLFENGIEVPDRWSTKVDQYGVTIIERITNALNRATNGVAEGLPIDEFLDKLVADAIKFTVDVTHNGDFIQIRIHRGDKPTDLNAAKVEDSAEIDLDSLAKEAESSKETETKEQTK